MPRPPSADIPTPVAITGPLGQLGRQLCHLLGTHAIPLPAEQMNLEFPAQIRSCLRQLRPKLLIHTAAYTAVDAAETDVERCMAVNRDAVQVLVDVTAELNCPLMQISTDYVFGGVPPSLPPRPFLETDVVAPQGVYALSKAEAESHVVRHPAYWIVRTCGLYGPPAPGGSGNFVNTIRRLARERPELRVVSDQICCPTYVVELAKAILFLARQADHGIYHVVNSGGLSWYALACEIVRLEKLDCSVVPITTAEYGAKAPRPSYSVLDISKYEALGGPAMSSCLAALAKYLSDNRQSPR
jgi:dTDP-4-dehydrorhamnose reductase